MESLKSMPMVAFCEVPPAERLAMAGNGWIDISGVEFFEAQTLISVKSSDPMFFNVKLKPVMDAAYKCGLRVYLYEKRISQSMEFHMQKLQYLPVVNLQTI